MKSETRAINEGAETQGIKAAAEQARQKLLDAKQRRRAAERAVEIDTRAIVAKKLSKPGGLGEGGLRD